MIASEELGLNTAAPTTLVVDLNCAVASIEQQHDPALRGKVLAIAAYATDAATIVSSSREARDRGIKTGMKVFEAKAQLRSTTRVVGAAVFSPSSSDAITHKCSHQSTDVATDIRDCRRSNA